MNDRRLLVPQAAKGEKPEERVDHVRHQSSNHRAEKPSSPQRRQQIERDLASGSRVFLSCGCEIGLKKEKQFGMKDVGVDLYSWDASATTDDVVEGVASPMAKGVAWLEFVLRSKDRTSFTDEIISFVVSIELKQMNKPPPSKPHGVAIVFFKFFRTHLLACDCLFFRERKSNRQLLRLCFCSFLLTFFSSPFFLELRQLRLTSLQRRLTVGLLFVVEFV